jgi:hypothetical protein
MDDVDQLGKLLTDAPWGSDLAFQEMKRRYPGAVWVNTTNARLDAVAKGYRMRGVFRNPYSPDVPFPVFVYSPPMASDAHTGARVNRRTTAWR